MQVLIFQLLALSLPESFFSWSLLELHERNLKKPKRTLLEEKAVLEQFKANGLRK